jgi:hypothetical protein
MHRRQPGAAGGLGAELVHGLPRERLPAFGDEEPGERVGTTGAIALDGTQLIAGDGMMKLLASRARDRASCLLALVNAIWIIEFGGRSAYHAQGWYAAR